MARPGWGGGWGGWELGSEDWGLGSRVGWELDGDRWGGDQVRWGLGGVQSRSHPTWLPCVPEEGGWKHGHSKNLGQANLGHVRTVQAGARVAPEAWCPES